MTYQESAYQQINIVDANGNIISSFGGSGGGGDASAANQAAVQANAGSDASKAVAVQGITNAKPIPTSSADFGTQADAVATTDTSPASQISLFKRLLQRVTTLINTVALDSTVQSILGRLPSALVGDRLKVDVQFPTGAATASTSVPVTLANDGIFATFAGTASEAASITGSIHAKLRAIATTLSQPATATRTVVPGNTTEALLLSASTTRKRTMFANSSSTGTWYIGYGSTTCTISNFTIAISPGDTYIEPAYAGIVRGFSSSATATDLIITEMS